MNTFDADIIRDVLANDDRVLFAYLYGSYTEGGRYRDIDIAVYSTIDTNPFRLSVDIKIRLHEATGISPDLFDVRIINGLIENGDLFALLYLRSIFKKNQIIADKDYNKRTEFLEKYSMKYRECEGLIGEVLM